MTKSNNPKTGKEKPGVDIEAIAQEAYGTATPIRAMHLANQVAASKKAIIGGGDGKVDGIVAIFDSITGFNPRDEAERMLISQMIASHEAAMECFRRAMLPDQTFEGRDMNLKHAEKLVSIYARQIEVLDKHCGKGKQKITVEHVNVHAGGQVIVGEVHAGETASQLTDQSDATRELADESSASDDGDKFKMAISPEQQILNARNDHQSVPGHARWQA